MSVIPAHASANPDPVDPTIAVVERQLAMLGALARMTMEVARGHAAADLAASNAVEVILADEYWVPETGRARALAGSKDAAEAFQKVSRSLRLTLAMELTTAETLRDLRAGITTCKATRQDAGGTPADQMRIEVRRRPAGSFQDDAPDRDRSEPGAERLAEFDRVEFDRPDRLPLDAFREVVNGLCADIGAAPDWDTWTVSWPELKYQPMKIRPVGWETRPPGSYPPEAHDVAAEQEAALSP